MVEEKLREELSVMRNRISDLEEANKVVEKKTVRTRSKERKSERPSAPEKKHRTPSKSRPK